MEPRSIERGNIDKLAVAIGAITSFNGATLN